MKQMHVRRGIKQKVSLVLFYPWGAFCCGRRIILQLKTAFVTLKGPEVPTTGTQGDLEVTLVFNELSRKNNNKPFYLLWNAWAWDGTPLVIHEQTPTSWWVSAKGKSIQKTSPTHTRTGGKRWGGSPTGESPQRGNVALMGGNDDDTDIDDSPLWESVRRVYQSPPWDEEGGAHREEDGGVTDGGGVSPGLALGKEGKSPRPTATRPPEPFEAMVLPSHIPTPYHWEWIDEGDKSTPTTPGGTSQPATPPVSPLPYAKGRQTELYKWSVMGTSPTVFPWISPS